MDIMPLCGSKTLNKVREDTVLINYLFYCPKCRQETLIEAKNLQVIVINRRRFEPVKRSFINRLSGISKSGG